MSKSSSVDVGQVDEFDESPLFSTVEEACEAADCCHGDPEIRERADYLFHNGVPESTDGGITVATVFIS